MGPLFRRRSKASLSSELDELDQSFKTNRYANVFSFHPDGSMSPPLRPTPSQIEEGVKNGTMKRCALSMLEMSEVKEMRDFGDVMNVIECFEEKGLEGELKKAAAAAGEEEEEEDDFLLVDTSERSRDDEDVDMNTSGFLHMSMTGMRRSVSTASFQTSNKQSLCLSTLPEIVDETSRVNQSPKETGEPEPQDTSAEHAITMVAIKIDDSEKQIGSEQSSNAENELDQSTKSILSTSSGNPLRSSFKRRDGHDELDRSSKSANLRSYLKSVDSTENKMKRNVSFTSLEIRSYNVTLGDAATSSGPPVSLDWQYDPQPQVIEIESYENHKTHRCREELVMPASHRKYLLMREAGFTRSEIQKAIDEAKRTAKRREWTKKNLHLQPVEEVLESTKRRFGKLIRKNIGEK